MWPEVAYTPCGTATFPYSGIELFYFMYFIFIFIFNQLLNWDSTAHRDTWEGGRCGESGVKNVWGIKCRTNTKTNTKTKTKTNTSRSRGTHVAGSQVVGHNTADTHKSKQMPRQIRGAIHGLRPHPFAYASAMTNLHYGRGVGSGGVARSAIICLKSFLLFALKLRKIKIMFLTLLFRTSFLFFLFFFFFF